MVMTSRTHTTLFAPAATTSNSATLVRLPLSVVPHYEARCQLTGALVPVRPFFRSNLWNSDEHERFLHGLEMFPNGPWKEVAKVVGTKSTRQTMTHAQKYRQKIKRRMQAKPISSKQKSRKRASQPTAIPHITFTAVFQEPMQSDVSVMSFSEGLLPCNTIPVTSPNEVYTDAFDTSFLDVEFDTLLAALKPAAQQYENMSAHAPDMPDVCPQAW